MDLSDKQGGSYPELEEFLSVPGRTLLIKGPPGAGKTTLALTLLQRLCAKTGLEDYPSGVYFSTRLSEEALQKQFPWVSFEELDLEDLRLSSIAGFLREVLRRIRSSSPLIVLDSWDAYAREMDEKDRLKTEKTVVLVASSSRSRLIFVSEDTRRVTLEYLVDGVVELSAENFDSRLFRASYLRKLRGISVKHHVKPYTLLGASVRTFGAYEEPDYGAVRPQEPICDFDNKYSFGSHSLDEKLGGIPYGSTVCVEYSYEVPLSALAALALPALVNFVLSGRSALVVPPAGFAAHTVAQWLLRVLGQKAATHVAICTEGAPASNQNMFFEMGGSLEESAQRLEEVAERLRQSSVDRRVMFVISLGRLENSHGREQEKVAWFLGKNASSVHSTLDAQICLVERLSPLKPKAVSMSDRHIKMRFRNGAVLVYGERPYTPLHVLEHEARNPLSPKITEVV